MTLLNRMVVMLIVGLGLIFLHFHWAHFAGFLLLFTVFDVYGFNKVGKFETGKEEGITEYRIIQFMFQILFMRYIYVIDGWPTVITCTFAWWLLVCDVLYYFALNEKLTPFDWFLLSPINFVFNVLFREPTPVWAVLTSAFIGAAFGLSLIVLERY